MSKMNTLDWIAFLLVIIGGINWGLIGILDFNLVDWLIGGFSQELVNLIYVFVGVSAIYSLFRIRW